MKNDMFLFITKKLASKSYNCVFPFSRFLSTQEAAERRSHLFALEKKRQLENVGRVEKIEVCYKGVPKEMTLIMNKDISTPYDCAKHMTEWHVNSSALAFIDSKLYWDMHRPLQGNCTLEFVNFQTDDPMQVNKAFWRTCSFLLGACASIAFKDNIALKLHSFPAPDIRSGSFVYDVDMSLPDWKPSDVELRTLTAEYLKFIRKNLPIERLDVSESLAKEMFIDNKHKTEQIPSIAQSTGNLTVYKVGNHVDISRGPMISNTSQIGSATITAVHKLEGNTSKELNNLYRFQGVALPSGAYLNHFAYDIIVKRAKNLNPAHSPFSVFEHEEWNKKQSRINKEALA